MNQWLNQFSGEWQIDFSLLEREPTQDEKDAATEAVNARGVVGETGAPDVAPLRGAEEGQT